MMRGFRHGRGRQCGQSLVEFTMILPILMTLVSGIAEFGIAFGTDMTLTQGTRGGARVGALLVDGGASGLGCSGVSGSDSVDPQIIAAVQRSLESPGTGIVRANINWIHIFKADANGAETAGFVNTWLPNGVSDVGPTICGVSLDFHRAVATDPWPSTARQNALPVESIGVSINYKYKLFTPLSALTGLFGASQITMIDATVMAFEP
jgi:TadE-like protein